MRAAPSRVRTARCSSRLRPDPRVGLRGGRTADGARGPEHPLRGPERQRHGDRQPRAARPSRCATTGPGSIRRPATASTPDSGRRPRQGPFSLTFPGARRGDRAGAGRRLHRRGGAVRGSRDHRNELTIFPGQPPRSRRRFPLRFAGGSFTTLFVDSRGAIQFDGGGFDADLAFFNEPLPSPFHSTLIAPFWDQHLADLRQNAADVVWEVTGTAPNRELVVEWRDLEPLRPLLRAVRGLRDVPGRVLRGRAATSCSTTGTRRSAASARTSIGGATATVGIQVGPDVATMFSFNTARARGRHVAAVDARPGRRSRRSA